jgi:hypothetical protein
MTSEEIAWRRPVTEPRLNASRPWEAFDPMTDTLPEVALRSSSNKRRAPEGSFRPLRG